MAAADFIAAINADTPKAFYQCQEASGTIVDSVAGGGVSLSNLFGTIAYQQPGPMSDFSIRFNTTGNAFSNNVPSLVIDNLTFGLWAKPGGGSISNGRRVFIGSGSGSRGWEIHVDLDGRFRYSINGGATDGALSVGALSSSAFKLIHVVRRSGTWEYYLNGVLDTSNAGTDTPTAALTSDSAQLGAGADLDIYIGYAFVFESAISSARILAHYNAGLVISPIPPISIPTQVSRW